MQPDRLQNDKTPYTYRVLEVKMFYALQIEVGLGKGVDDNVRPRVV